MITKILGKGIMLLIAESGIELLTFDTMGWIPNGVSHFMEDTYGKEPWQKLNPKTTNPFYNKNKGNVWYLLKSNKGIIKIHTCWSK